MVDWIDDRARLERWIERSERPERVAIDCEANGFHAYRARLCLIQMARETGAGIDVALIDALALGDELAALEGLFSDPQIEKILHGAANDVRMLDRDAGLHLRGLLDTEVAARLLGLPRSGLATLSEELAGRTLSKAGQRMDWARRPLPDKALTYAAEDVEPLFAVRDALVERIERAGRRVWLDEECRALEALRWEEPEPLTAEELVARTKGTGGMDARSREILGRLLLWREREAARRDVPAIKIASPAVLVRIAEKRPTTGQELERAGVDQRLGRRYGKALLAAVRRGGEAPLRGDDSRARRTGGRPPVDGDRMAALKRLRRRRAAELEIDEGTLCPTDVLREIARRPPEEVGSLVGERLRRWQARALGLVG